MGKERSACRIGDCEMSASRPVLVATDGGVMEGHTRIAAAAAQVLRHHALRHNGYPTIALRG
jgi:hypothetical protein